MDDSSHTLPFSAPTADRPLLGLTVLVVEDSRFACEAMRLLCLRSGARIRRADCLRSARRHLKVYRPSVIIVDLGLPDGSGAELIDELSRVTPRVDVILGTSGDSDARHIALAAGADEFIAKPIVSLGAFQEVVIAQLPPERQIMGPRAVNTSNVTPDRLAYRDDMAHIAEVLIEVVDDRALDYLVQFATGVAVSADDLPMVEAVQSLRNAREAGRPARADLARMAGLVQDRLNDKIAL